MADRFDELDRNITEWMTRYGVRLLRISLGVVFLWFGIHKWVPGYSPVEELAGTTISALTGGRIGPALSVPFLGFWEAVIGVGLITGKAVRLTVLFLVLHLIGAATPLFLFSERMFLRFPIALTLEGQYILKNLVLASAAIVVGSTARSGSSVSVDRAPR